MPRIYTGTLLLGLGAFKALVGVAVYWTVLVEVARDGVVATVSDTGTPAAALWFLFAAGLMMLLGHCVRAGEQHGRSPSRGFAVGLFGVAAFAVTLMPENGAWLMFPIAVLAFRRGH